MTIGQTAQLRWEPVHTTAHGKRCVVYWRLLDGQESVGAVSRRTADDQLALRAADTASWRALGYDPRRGHPATELDHHRTRRDAEAAVLTYYREAYSTKEHRDPTPRTARRQ